MNLQNGGSATDGRKVLRAAAQIAMHIYSLDAMEKVRINVRGKIYFSGKFLQMEGCEDSPRAHVL